MAKTKYFYENEQDGYCEFATKKAAIGHAEKSRWHSHENREVKSTVTGKCVYEVQGKTVADSYYE